jgi:NDP-sugar pyrophosphorylase family protein
VRYSWERNILGSAGGPARALPLIGAEQFFIVNGDTLTDLNLNALAADHRCSGARVTLALVPNPDPLHYGGVTVDGDGRVIGFTARGPANTGLHFIGVQAADADVFASLDPDVPAESFGGIYRDLMAQRPGCVRAFVSGAAFRDIGTAADYLDTCLDVARIEHSEACLMGRGVMAADGALITDCVVWDDVRVGRGATLDRSVVASGVSIPAGASYRRSVVRLRGDHPTEPGEQIVGDLLVSLIDSRRLTAGRPGV